MGKKTDELLEKLGGKKIYKYGEGDDNCSLEEDFNDWKKNIWPVLQKDAEAN
jgi:NADPH-ferrihemoprotein reductase